MDFSGLPRLELARNETLFVEGDPGRELYLLLAGQLGVYRSGERLATIADPMSIVGEMSALSGAPRAASVQALKRSTLIVVDDPEELFARYPRLGLKLARVLADRLRDMNGRYRELRDKLGARPDQAASGADPGKAAASKPRPRPPSDAINLDDPRMRDALLDALDSLFDESLGA